MPKKNCKTIDKKNKTIICDVKKKKFRTTV